MSKLELQDDLFRNFKSLTGQYPCFIAFSKPYTRDVCKYLDQQNIKYFHYNGLDYDGIYKYFIRII